MPFRSRAQQRWAWATKQPWARKWADKTRSFKALPERKGKGKAKRGKR